MDRNSFLAYSGGYAAFNGSNNPGYYVNISGPRFDSYRVSNDLITTHNSAAIVAETPTAVFKAAPFKDYTTSESSDLPNFFMRRVYSGEVEVITATDSLVTYATPFVDLGSFKNQALTAAGGSKVYVIGLTHSSLF